MGRNQLEGHCHSDPIRKHLLPTKRAWRDINDTEAQGCLK